MPQGRTALAQAIEDWPRHLVTKNATALESFGVAAQASHLKGYYLSAQAMACNILSARFSRFLLENGSSRLWEPWSA